MPYFIDGIVELPLTTIQDYSLLHILRESTIKIWEQQIALIQQRNGLISFIVHPDYLGGEQELALYRSLLAKLSACARKQGCGSQFPAKLIDGGEPGTR